MRYKIFIKTVCLFCLTTLFSCIQQKDKNKPIVKDVNEQYTCSMHPEIIRDAPGDCPICGMHLIKKVTDSETVKDVDLNTLLQPTNNFVVSSIPMTTVKFEAEPYVIKALGTVAYDTREEATIASKISGRIEKLYLRYRYQQVEKDQKIMEIYSPEMVTAEQNLLFLVQNDPTNTSLIESSKKRLNLLGLDDLQIEQIIKNKTPELKISVYSKYSGHIHEAGNSKMNSVQSGMKDIASITEELPLKEGMYVTKGETIFTVYNPAKAWVLLNLFGADQSFVKTGNEVFITPETSPDHPFLAKINFIEPFFRKEAKTVTARVYFDNAALHIPIGTQVKAEIKGTTAKSFWLTQESIVSLGLDKIVFLRQGGGFLAHSVKTGISSNKKIEIKEGLTVNDSIAMNAQYLMDSESFIKLKK